MDTKMDTSGEDSKHNIYVQYSKSDGYCITKPKVTTKSIIFIKSQDSNCYPFAGLQCIH